PGQSRAAGPVGPNLRASGRAGPQEHFAGRILGGLPAGTLNPAGSRPRPSRIRGVPLGPREVTCADPRDPADVMPDRRGVTKSRVFSFPNETNQGFSSNGLRPEV